MDLNEMVPEYDETKRPLPPRVGGIIQLTGPCCGNCSYMRLAGTEGVIPECRRNSPRPVATSSKTPMAAWPVVFPTDWCGDHKMKGS